MNHMDKPTRSSSGQSTDKNHLTDTIQAIAGSDTKTNDVSRPVDIES